MHPFILKYYVIRFLETYARSMKGGTGTLYSNLKYLTPIITISLLGY